MIRRQFPNLIVRVVVLKGIQSAAPIANLTAGLVVIQMSSQKVIKESGLYADLGSVVSTFKFGLVGRQGKRQVTTNTSPGKEQCMTRKINGLLKVLRKWRTRRISFIHDMVSMQLGALIAISSLLRK